MHIAFLTKDLMFQSRVAGQAKARSLGLVADRTVDRLLGRLTNPAEVRLWFVDLTLDIDDLVSIRRTVLDQCPKASIVAFGPHVHADRLEQASTAGFDRVLTRGQFDHQIPQMLAELAESIGTVEE